jgi:hypothetical protein
MGDDNNDLALTAREWFAARIVIIGGFIIAIVVAGYFTWRQHEQAQKAAAAEQAQEQADAKAAAGPGPAQLSVEAQRRVGLIVCLRELANAEDSGLVPNYSKLTSPIPHATKVQGRYLCHAGTDVANYNIVADLNCRDMRKADCAKLYSVTRDDGTVLYQAKE